MSRVVKTGAACFAVVTTILLIFGLRDNACAQQLPASPKYLGHIVKVRIPEQEGDGSPKGSASVCLELESNSQCYKAPKDFANNPSVTIVQLTADETAILFSAESGGIGVSHWSIHFALLRPGNGKNLDNLFPAQLFVSNQSQHAIWDEKTLSSSKIFVLADDEWGPDEGHYGSHRYIISAYSRKERLFPGDPDDAFYLRDRYMTSAKYDVEANDNVDVLSSEKKEIIARLARVKAEELRHQTDR